MGEDLRSVWMDALIERATGKEADLKRTPVVMGPVGSAGVYRSTSMVPGMATYYVLTHAGVLYRDELRSVRPDTMLELETIAEMSRRFDELRPELRLEGTDGNDWG